MKERFSKLITTKSNNNKEHKNIISIVYKWDKNFIKKSIENGRIESNYNDYINEFCKNVYPVYYAERCLIHLISRSVPIKKQGVPGENLLMHDSIGYSENKYYKEPSNIISQETCLRNNIYYIPDAITDYTHLKSNILTDNKNAITIKYIFNLNPYFCNFTHGKKIDGRVSVTKNIESDLRICKIPSI